MSRQLNVDTAQFSELKGKVIVLTGGSTGIGAALVRILHENGALVVFGDVNVAAATPLINSFFNPNDKITVHFLPTDVTKYEDVLNLFQKAYDLYGRVDSAISLAAIVEQGNWFDPDLTLETIKKSPSLKVQDVNLTGSLYFARIAAVYLKQGHSTTSSEDKSLILFSSVAGFIESPGLFIYQATKHGILGLMRSLRRYLPKSHNIRVNAICPWMTRTQLVSGIEKAWAEAGLPENTPEDVANIVTSIIVNKDGLNGGAIYCEGGRGWEIEGGIKETQKIWLGERQTAELTKGQAVLGDGMGWTKGTGQLGE